ncbi:MAG: DUF4292 domain-containing protein [Calditrichaceae bacterium]
MFKYSVLFVSIVALILSSCTSSKKVVIPDLTEVTYRDLLQLNSGWQKSIKNLSGSARITLDTQQYSGNFGADVALSGDDSLLISVTGPLGIRVGKVFISKNRFIFYNQVMNQFYTGKKEAFVGKNFLQFPIEISNLRSLFLAQDRFEILKKDRFTIRDQMYFLTAQNGSNEYKIWFDPAIKLIRRIEYLRDNELLYYKEYDDFKLINNIYFPNVINYVRVVSPDEKQGLSVLFNELSINEYIQPDVFDINVSDNATQIDLSLENQP